MDPTDVASKLIADKTSLLLDFIVGNMTSSPPPSSGRPQDYTSPESSASGLSPSTSLESLKNTLSAFYTSDWTPGRTSKPIYSIPYETTSDDDVMTTIHGSGFFPTDGDAEFSGETNIDFGSPTYGDHFSTKLNGDTIMTTDDVDYHPMDFSTHGPGRSRMPYTDSFAPTMEEEFSFTTDQEESVSGYTLCSEAESLGQGCRNDGVCVTRMEGEERRAMCKCESGFTGEKCDVKYNDLLWETKNPTVETWLPWSISITLALAICLLIVFLICYMKRHRTPSPAESRTLSRARSDPEKGYVTDSGRSSQSSSYRAITGGNGDLVANGNCHLSSNGYGGNGYHCNLSTFGHSPKPQDKGAFSGTVKDIYATPKGHVIAGNSNNNNNLGVRDNNIDSITSL